jgi:truncated hemoglobin YjbI
MDMAASVQPPPDVPKRRPGPLFDKYVLSGRTYVTANGTVVPNELQYYSGEMAHFYGECTNVSAVNEVLAGSGYKAITLRYADGKQTAVAQVWSNRFTDTTIGPYSAMFIVVIVVRDDAPPSQACIRADANGASSVLVMLDGSFDPAKAVYENRALMFQVRLLDTTQVAIDVGRERMGTDKRPGTVDMGRNGRRLCVSIKDQAGRGVVRADLELADDPNAYTPAVATAAATAGIQFRSLPQGTEYVYPGVARIGRAPVVSWQWHSDVVPQLQRVVPGTVAIDSSSEEGRMLVSWGFTPKVLGYISNVRGVITGLAAQTPRSVTQPSISSMASDVLEAGISNIPLLRAAGPGNNGGIVGQLPVLRLVTEQISPRLGALVSTPPHENRANAVGTAPDSQRRWGWNTTFLGTVTAMLRKEVVGVMPDSLRINWHVIEGTFVGPGVEATILPGATDWSRIRKDGVGTVNVQATLETRTGARIYARYGGLFDLGPDGYARALRDDFDPLPPVVVTPIYATADAQFEWLNRAQCIGVGRMDMSILRFEFDVYVVRVGDRPRSDANTKAGSLYTRIGAHNVVVAITEDFVDWSLADKKLGRFFPNVRPGPTLDALNERIVEFLCSITGGPCVYKGRDMKTTHKGLGINEEDWQIAIDLFTAALQKHHVSPQARSEFLQIIDDMKGDIVEVP